MTCVKTFKLLENLAKLLIGSQATWNNSDMSKGFLQVKINALKQLQNFIQDR